MRGHLIHYSLLTAHCSLLTAHCSLLAINCSRFTERMRSLKYTRLWLTIGWLLVLAVVWVSLVPREPELVKHLGDKLSHAVAYFVLMAWFVQIYRPTRMLGLLAVGFVILGITLELLQGLLATRIADAGDVFADAVGVAVGMAIAATPLADLLVRLERWTLRGE
jgi:VanZ family protein